MRSAIAPIRDLGSRCFGVASSTSCSSSSELRVASRLSPPRAANLCGLLPRRVEVKSGSSVVSAPCSWFPAAGREASSGRCSSWRHTFGVGGDGNRGGAAGEKAADRTVVPSNLLNCCLRFCPAFFRPAFPPALRCAALALRIRCLLRILRRLFSARTLPAHYM